MTESYYPRHTRGEEEAQRIHLEWMTEVSKVAHLRVVIKELLAALMLPDMEQRTRAVEAAEQALRATEKP